MRYEFLKFIKKEYERITDYLPRLRIPDQKLAFLLEYIVTQRNPCVKFSFSSCFFGLQLGWTTSFVKYSCKDVLQCPRKKPC
jgi:hypothetical protein